MGVIRIEDDGSENKQDRKYANKFEKDPESPMRSRLKQGAKLTPMKKKKKKKIGAGGIAQDLFAGEGEEY